MSGILDGSGTQLGSMIRHGSETNKSLYTPYITEGMKG
jgi:hypothetical protein